MELCVNWENVLSWIGVIVYIIIGLYLFRKKIKRDLKEDKKIEGQ